MKVCIREEATAFKYFQPDQVQERLQLRADKYFDQFNTVAFKKVCGNNYSSQLPTTGRNFFGNVPK